MRGSISVVDTMEKRWYFLPSRGGSGIGKTAEKLEPYLKGAGIADAKRVSSVGELTSWVK